MLLHLQSNFLQHRNLRPFINNWQGSSNWRLRYLSPAGETFYKNVLTGEVKMWAAAVDTSCEVS